MSAYHLLQPNATYVLAQDGAVSWLIDLEPARGDVCNVGL